MKFKTNIKCSGCVAAASPVLNEVLGSENWSVETSSTEKVLTVTPTEAIDDQDVIIAVKEAGFNAEKIN